MLNTKPAKAKKKPYAAAATPFEFDLEKQLKDGAKRKQILKRCDERIVQLRDLLRQGGSQELFDQLTTLLNAYTALRRVVERVR